MALLGAREREVIPDARNNFTCRYLKLSSIPTVADKSQCIGEEAGHAVLKGEEVHDLRWNATRNRLCVEVLINLEPHHDAKVDVFICQTGT